MAKIFYYGTDNQIYGPETEQNVQNWYASGYFSSDIKFQISSSERHDPKGLVFTLGQLIELNGRVLPFFFDVEKTNREVEHETTIRKLNKEVESLRASFNDLQQKSQTEKKPECEEKESIRVLKRQVASLLETQSDLLRRLDTLSNQKEQKENSPVPAQLEKRVTEVKKRVDEQEKNITSMKKEISSVTSKCDRTDTKMEKLVEKQQEAEETVNGYDKRIYDLKSSEDAIRDSLRTCENNATSSTAQIESIKSDLTAIRNELEDQKQKHKSLDVASVSNPIESNKPVKMEAAEEEDVPPWEKEESKAEVEKKKEDSPFLENDTDDEPEPWNHINQKEKKAQSVKDSKADMEVKPNSKTKNWDAICKELSDDDDEGEELTHVPAENSVVQPILNSSVPVPAKNMALIEQFMEMLRVYLKAMSLSKLAELENYGPHALIGLTVLLEWDSLTPQFIPLARAMLLEMPKLCDEMELLCYDCPCRIFTPVNLLDHLVDPTHLEMVKKFGPVATLHAYSAQRVVGKLSNLLRRTSPFNRESQMNLNGERLFKNVEPARLRPTMEFVNSKLDYYLDLAIAGDTRAKALEKEARKEGELFPSDNEYFMRTIRKWFKVEKNQWRFLEDFDEHISTGVPHCSECKVAFESKNDFYKHVTSYTHARVDHRLFGGLFIRLARGTRDWDITM